MSEQVRVSRGSGRGEEVDGHCEQPPQRLGRASPIEAEGRPGLVGHGVDDHGRAHWQPAHLAESEQGSSLHLDRTGAMGPMVADLLGRGAEDTVGRHRGAGGVGEAGRLQRRGVAGGQAGSTAP